MANLNRGECLDHHVTIQRAHFAQEPQIPLLFQTWMQPADHVDFGNSERECITNGPHDFLDRKLERMRVALPSGKGAELAGEDADVRIIEVAIVYVGREVAVLLFAHRRDHDPYGVQVFTTKELERVALVNALPALDLFGDR